MFVRWAREAASGTMPPNGRCSSICEAIRLLSIQRPSRTTATAVSSQEVSKASTRIEAIAPRELGRAGGRLLGRQVVAVERAVGEHIELVVRGDEGHVAQ